MSRPEPLDPFAGDPDDPARAMADLDDDADVPPPLSPPEREGVLGDLVDLELFEALLAPRGVLGLTVGCPDCGVDHHVSWVLLRGNLRHLLDAGTPRVHEPAVGAAAADYVSWDYARGYTDASMADDESGL